MDEESCGNCRFWHPSWRFKKGAVSDELAPNELSLQKTSMIRKKQSERGLCRRYAPQASALTTVWMETKVWDWCGDYDRDKKAPRHGSGFHTVG